VFGICRGVNYLFCSNFFSTPTLWLFFVFVLVYYVTACAVLLTTLVTLWLPQYSTESLETYFSLLKHQYVLLLPALIHEVIML
jgi:hypothetical protein